MKNIQLGYNKKNNVFFMVTFPYDDDILDAIRKIPNRRFDKKSKSWLIQSDHSVVRYIEVFAQYFGFEVSVDAQALLNHLKQPATEDIILPPIKGTLRQFQKLCVAYATKYERCFIADEMGLGKSAESIVSVEKLNGYPCLIICPASLKLNWQREVNMWVNKSSLIINGKQEISNYNADYVIINYDVVQYHQENLKKMKFKSIILDESQYCFPYYTNIITEDGNKYIGDIVEHKLKCKILSYDLKKNKYIFKNIDTYIKNDNSERTLKICHENGNLICRENHPIYIKGKSYVSAKNITPGDCVQMVSDTILQQTPRKKTTNIMLTKLRIKIYHIITKCKIENIKCCQQAINKNILFTMSHRIFNTFKRKSIIKTKILWQIMLSKIQKFITNSNRTFQKTDCIHEKNEKLLQVAGNECTNEIAQSNVQQRNLQKGIKCIAWENIFKPRRKWTTYCSTKTISREAWYWNRKYGISNFYKKCSGTFQIFANKLQSRFSISINKIGNRSRWQYTQNKKMEIFRQTKRRNIKFSRVESITVLEQGDFRKYGWCNDADKYSYCLEIPETHNFFAENVLVSNCKSYKSQRTKIIKSISSNIKYRFALTGTPILNRPNELIPQLDILSRLDYFGGFWTFAKKYCGAKETNFGWDFSGATNLDELNEKMKSICFIRRLKSEVLTELPAKQKTFIPIEIDNRREYNTVERDFINWIKTNVIKPDTYEAEVAGIKNLTAKQKKMLVEDKMEQRLNRAKTSEAMIKIEYLKQVVADGKIARFKEFIDNVIEQGNKLVVFASHTKIQRELYEHYRQYNAARIFKDDSTALRQENVDRFQNDENCPLIIVSLAAGGVGITLTAASRVAFMEFGWTPAIHDQAEDRCHRIGQKDCVNAYYFYGKNTIDEDIMSLIEKKRAIALNISDGVSMEAQTNDIDDILKKFT